MKFAANKIYCLYNTGNNFETIFYRPANEDYFLQKVNTYVLPFAQILHVCLAKNQFHILIKTKSQVDSLEMSKNIGIMLRSYTRAINIQEKRIGSLFRSSTKNFSRLAELPSYLKEKIKPFLVKKEPGQSVNFEETMLSFLKALDAALAQNDPKEANYSLLKILWHPFKYLKRFSLDPHKMHGQYGRPFNLAKGKNIIRDT